MPLSKATILGGAVGNFLSLGRMRHPKAARPLIDYESSTFMQSGELLGVVFGVLLNKLLPSILIILFLIAILSWNSYRTINKARAIRRKETAAMDKAAAASASAAVAPKAEELPVSAADDVEATAVTASGGGKGGEGGEAAEGAAEGGEGGADGEVAAPEVKVEVLGAKREEPKADGVKAGAKAGAISELELEEILKAESQQFPLWAWTLLALMTAYTLLSSFISKAIQTSDSCKVHVHVHPDLGQLHVHVHVHVHPDLGQLQGACALPSAWLQPWPWAWPCASEAATQGDAPARPCLLRTRAVRAGLGILAVVRHAHTGARRVHVRDGDHPR